jgi:membrane-associated phospholipid phosphatase
MHKITFEKHVKNKNLLWLFGYMTLATLIGVIFEKGVPELWINKHHNVVFDQFFKYMTFFGDGWLYVILAVAFLFYRYSWFLFLALSIIIQTALVQIPKRVIWPELVRPSLYLEGADIHFVEGVKINGYYSFPSGHTATAFTIATILIFIFYRVKWLHFPLALCAILAGFSRVYLMQHFFIDTAAGAFFGVLAVWISYYFLHETFRYTSLKEGLFFKA